MSQKEGIPDLSWPQGGVRLTLHSGILFPALRPRSESSKQSEELGVEFGGKKQVDRRMRVVFASNSFYFCDPNQCTLFQHGV